ncbi:hypothetical protein TRFO_04286 [Tritrichomonas foetus]|uniref:Protein kinase domain-containing protein n=1 Tax=Tritrichomonas foetus TaxID=1144522 RepID=A0A1J4KKA1_9EUKA|nr:hypothetical protein TRFO_04286 [Tritrichomonas foetus]|eukprot:OHT10268.1 hypothetical protein TRFO_04286 [Tritrichomonas foetus]
MALVNNPIIAEFQNFMLDSTHFTKTDDIPEEGPFGICFKARNNRAASDDIDDKYVVIREQLSNDEIEIGPFDDDDDNVPQKIDRQSGSKRFLREIEFFIKVKPHCGIVKFHGYFLSPEMSIVTAYLPGPTLNTLIIEKSTRFERIWTDTFKDKLIFGIAASMMHLHSYKAVHRYLVPKNIKFDRNMNPKITNFCYSKTEVDGNAVMNSKFDIQEPFFMAPELLIREGGKQPNFTNKVDVYSFAILAYVILYGSYDNLLTIKAKDRGEPEKIINSLTFPSDVSPLLKSIIQHSWKIDPKMRPSFPQIVKALLDKDKLFPNTDVNELDTFKQRYFETVNIAPCDRGLFKEKINANNSSRRGSSRPRRSKRPTKRSNRPSAKSSTNDSDRGADRDSTKSSAETSLESVDSEKLHPMTPIKPKNKKTKPILDSDHDSENEPEIEAEIESEVEVKHESEPEIDVDVKDDDEEVAPLFEGISTFDSVMEEANRGDTNAMVRAGRMLQKGDNCRKDQTKAYRMFKKAADAGNGIGLFNTALCKALGIGTNVDEEEAFRIMEIAARPDKRNPVAMNEFGEMLQDRGDDENAIKYYEKAMKLQDTKAIFNMGKMMEKQGRINDAMRHFKQAGEAGIEEGSNNYAILLLENEKTINQGVTVLKQLSSRYPLACFNLGMIYKIGNYIGHEQDLELAFEYFKAAANLHHPKGCLHYALCLKRGEGTPKNEELSIKYFEKAVRLGDDVAMVILAAYLKDGTLIEEDLERSAELLRFAAEEENPVAMFRYGEYLENGIGVTKDLGIAQEMYRKAAERGNKDAIKKLRLL